MQGERLAVTDRVLCLTAPDSEQTVATLERILDAHDVTLRVRQVGETISPEDWTDGTTLGVTVGGDGTFLSGVSAFAPRSIPFFGVNTGTLGFLAQTQPDELAAAIESVFSGRASITPRKRFRVTGPEFDATGINEVTVELPMPDDPVGRKVCRLAVAAGTEFLGEYEGTGVAVAVPTGSTGMALSADGPIQKPGYNDTVQISSLHTNRLGRRSVVLGGDQQIQIAVDSSVRVTVDGGRPQHQVDADTVLTVSGSPEPAYLVAPAGNMAFFEALDEKLGWGGRNGKPPVDSRSRSIEQPTRLERYRETGVRAVRAAGEQLFESQPSAPLPDSSREETLSALCQESREILAVSVAGPPTRSAHENQARDDESGQWLPLALDGEDNFSRGDPHYTIGITRTSPRPVASALITPAFDELFVGSHDGTLSRGGAGLSDDPLAVDPLPEPVPVETSDCVTLTESTLLTTGEITATAVSPEATERRLGCDSLGLCAVAAGRAEACWLPSTSPEIAACGCCLVRAGGGRVSTWEGDPYRVDPSERDQPRLLASNGPIHETVRKRLQTARQ